MLGVSSGLHQRILLHDSSDPPRVYLVDFFLAFNSRFRSLFRCEACSHSLHHRWPHISTTNFSKFLSELYFQVGVHTIASIGLFVHLKFFVFCHRSVLRSEIQNRASFSLLQRWALRLPVGTPSWECYLSPAIQQALQISMHNACSSTTHNSPWQD